MFWSSAWRTGSIQLLETFSSFFNILPTFMPNSWLSIKDKQAFRHICLSRDSLRWLSLQENVSSRRMFTVILSWDMDVASDAIYCFCPNGLRSVHKPRHVFFVMCWVYIQIESQSPSSCHPVCVKAPRVLGCWCLTSVKEFYPWSLLQPQSSASWNTLCLVFGKCLPFQYTDFYSLFHTVRQ